MKTYLMSLGFEVWNTIENGYTAPTTPLVLPTSIKLNANNSNSKNAIICGLDESMFVKVMHYASTKEIWDKLQNVYEGDDKVNKEKILNL
jgi:hypothetical protein